MPQDRTLKAIKSRSRSEQVSVVSLLLLPLLGMYCLLIPDTVTVMNAATMRRSSARFPVRAHEGRANADLTASTAQSTCIAACAKNTTSTPRPSHSWMPMPVRAGLAATR